MAVESWILTDHRQALTWRQKRNDSLYGAENTNTSFCTSRTTHTTKSNRRSICRMRLSTSASEKKTTTFRSIDPCTIAPNCYVEFATTSATRVIMFCHHGWTKRRSPGDLVRRGGTARSPERVKFQAAVFRYSCTCLTSRTLSVSPIACWALVGSRKVHVEPVSRTILQSISSGHSR